jgi:WD40 repeat protein
MFQAPLKTTECVFWPLCLITLVFVAMILAGCGRLPSRTPEEQSTASTTPMWPPQKSLPVTPTRASHDFSKARIIDGSAAPVVQWPAASDTADPAPVIEVSSSQELRWSAEFPITTTHDLAWSPDGEFLAVGGRLHTDKELFHAPTLLYSQNGTVVEELVTDYATGNGSGVSVSDLEWSIDGKVLATAGGLNASATLFYPADKRKLELTNIAISVHGVRWSPDGRYVILTTGDQDMYLYDAEGNRLTVVGPASPTAGSLAWNPDGTMLASSDPLGVMFWGLQENGSSEDSNKSVSLVPLVRVTLSSGKDISALTLEWNQDGSRLAVGAFDTGDVWLIDRDGTPVATLRGHTESVWRTCFSAKGILATTSSDATTRLWDQDGNPIAVLISATREEEILIDVAAWSPDGEHLAVASPNDVIRIYSSGAVPLANLRGHAGNIQGLSWHPSGRRLASSDDKKITHLWDLPAQLP